MSVQTWQETLTVQQAAGTLFNTYTTAKTVINPQALYTLPANYFYVGRKLRATIKGGISNIVTTPGTLNFQIKVGSVAAFDTGAIQLNATAHTTLPFWLEIELICRSVGSGTSATLFGMGQINSVVVTRTAGQTDDAQGMQTLVVPQTAPAVGTGFDSTVANIIDLWAGFSISGAGNGVQIQSYTLESLN